MPSPLPPRPTCPLRPTAPMPSPLPPSTHRPHAQGPLTRALPQYAYPRFPPGQSITQDDVLRYEPAGKMTVLFSPSPYLPSLPSFLSTSRPSPLFPTLSSSSFLSSIFPSLPPSLQFQNTFRHREWRFGRVLNSFRTTTQRGAGKSPYFFPSLFSQPLFFFLVSIKDKKKR